MISLIQAAWMIIATELRFQETASITTGTLSSPSPFIAILLTLNPLNSCPAWIRGINCIKSLHHFNLRQQLGCVSNHAIAVFKGKITGPTPKIPLSRRRQYSILAAIEVAMSKSSTVESGIWCLNFDFDFEGMVDEEVVAGDVEQGGSEDAGSDEGDFESMSINALLLFLSIPESIKHAVQYSKYVSTVSNLSYSRGM